MDCPQCDKFVSHSWLSENDIEGNDEFECPNCNTELRFIADEGTYNGAQSTYLELVDD